MDDSPHQSFDRFRTIKELKVRVGDKIWHAEVDIIMSLSTTIEGPVSTAADNEKLAVVRRKETSKQQSNLTVRVGDQLWSRQVQLVLPNPHRIIHVSTLDIFKSDNDSTSSNYSDTNKMKLVNKETSMRTPLRRSVRIAVMTRKQPTYDQDFMDKCYRKYFSVEDLPVLGSIAHVCVDLRRFKYVEPNQQRFDVVVKNFFRFVPRLLKREKRRLKTMKECEISMFQRTDINIKEKVKKKDSLHLYIYKSSLGANRSEPMFISEPHGDNNFYFKDQVYDHDLYAQSGHGLFAGRRFEQHEIIGILLGVVVHETNLRNSTYAIDYHPNENLDEETELVVDPSPYLNRLLFFGLHYANDARGDPNKHNNTFVDVNMRAYAMEVIEKHGEIFWYYGDKQF